MKPYQNLSKTDKSMNLKTLKLEVKDLLNNSIGKKTILQKSGALVHKILVPTWLWIWQREFNIWTKLKNQWFHLSKTLQNKEFFVNKIWEVWDLTLLIVNFTLTLFTEVEDKLCHLPEDFIMLLNYFVNQPFLNQYSTAK